MNHTVTNQTTVERFEGTGIPTNRLQRKTLEAALDTINALMTNIMDVFAYKVSGDCMEDAGIFDGDILFVNRSLRPRNGSIVVAWYDGETVVKRLLLKEEGAFLVAERKEAPVEVKDYDMVHIFGVVTGSIRRFPHP